ncbi:MAG: histidine kinase N-terminal domain-containing protein, partial [Ilumatobacteraceae bacterium]|nr:histidine kinase N-terminal domain-containing protein [Ilumatobacteraceae bacterium]
RAFASGEICEGELHKRNIFDSIHVLAIPVHGEAGPIAVLTREWSSKTSRQPGELERTYLSIFQRIAEMITQGAFPFRGRAADLSAAPRVGDGAIVLDEQAVIRYASPNAVSALHRVGITANVVGQSVSELGFADSPVRQAFERHEPVIEEFDQTADVTLLVRCLPIIASQVITGGMLLIRDVTEVRRRDRLLLSKDATIREIHHRVKNNLQTISSLLRLQARRLESPEAKAAIQESVRRIRTIALVHETLSRETGDDVAFIEIVRPLLRLVEEGLQSPDRPVRFIVQGDGGRLPATVATPLSVVLTELLQNAVDHGFPEGSAGGTVVVELGGTDDDIEIKVINDGRVLDPAFDLNGVTGLGLSIVRTLVTTELNGSILIRAGVAEDFSAAGIEDHRSGDGTVVQLSLPR